MGQFRVHLVKFFNYLPSTIQCLSYDKRSNRLAVGRADASVEIWSLEDRWYIERVRLCREDDRIYPFFVLPEQYVHWGHL